MFKIALSGMKGRRKDTLLMGGVIVLAIVFVVTSIVLYSSSEKTKYHEKTQTFGKWQQAVSGETQSKATLYKHYGENTHIGTLQNIGASDTTGAIATFDSTYLDLANFRLIEGRMPTADNEIAFENNQLSNFRSEVAIGDEIPVVMRINVLRKDMLSAIAEQKASYMYHHFSEMLDYVKKYPRSVIADYMNNFPNFFYSDVLIPHFEALAKDSGEFLTNSYSLDKKQALINAQFKEFLYRRFTGNNTRNTLDTVVYNDMRVEVKQSLLYAFFKPVGANFIMGVGDDATEGAVNTTMSLEKIKERGTVTSQEIVITRPMIVTGFIDNYTKDWTTDGYKMPSAYITASSGAQFQNAFYNNTFLDVSHITPQSLYFLSGKEVFDKTDTSSYNISFRNNGTFPEVATETDRTLTYGFLSLIFISTIAAVFQINLTQMKRRARKLTLLKSIGAVKKQIRHLLISELVIYCLIGLLLGIFLGFLLSYVAIVLLKAFFNTTLIFGVNWDMLFGGLVLAILSIVLGSLIPMIKALKIPLTGAMNPPPKRRKVVVKNHKRHKLTFARISIEHAKSDRKKNLIALGLYTLAITTLLLTVTLSFVGFEPYIDDVIITDAPEYTIDLYYGIGKRDLESLKETVTALPNVEDVYLYKYGVDGYFYHPRIRLHEPFTTLKPRYIYNTYDNVDKSNQHLIKNALFVDSYGVSTEERVFKTLLANGVGDTLNIEAFEKGEEVILLLPNYKSGAVSYSFKSRDTYADAYGLTVGDSIQMTLPTEKITGTQISNNVAFHTLKVGAIVNDFDRVGIWPFSHSLEMPVLITSYKGISTLYPASVSTPRLSPYEMERLLNSYAPTRFGRTAAHIYMAKGYDPLETEAALKKAKGYLYGKVNRQYVENKFKFKINLKRVVITLLLGISIALITLIILYNTALSKVENERKRIGTLQSLGVTAKQFRRLYRITGVLFAFLSTTGALAINAVVLYKLFGTLLEVWLYPYTAIVGLCLLFFVLALGSYYLPIKRILKNQPIHNIQSQQN